MANSALTTSTAGATEAANGQGVYPCSVSGNWVTLHADLEQAADASTELTQVLTTNNTGARFLKVPPFATRMIARVKYTTAGTSPTNPVVRFYGSDVWSATGVIDLSTPSILMRLDNADNAAAGLTFTMTTATDVADSTYSYSNPMPSLTGIDLQGCVAVLPIVTTAAALTSGTVELQVRFLN